MVVTPTIRPEGLHVVREALENQTFVDFDWLVCSPFDPKPFADWATWVPDNFKGGHWTLNRAYQAMIKQADCDLIVSWQDFTHAGRDALARFYKNYLFDDKLLVSAIGDKYENEIFKVKTWSDPRTAGKCNFYDIEWNLCSCPKKGLEEVGGFVEEMDFEGYGMDGYCVNERLAEVGYSFYIDEKIMSYSVGHGRVDNWEEKNLIHGGYEKIKQKLKSENRWPIIGKL